MMNNKISFGQVLTKFLNRGHGRSKIFNRCGILSASIRSFILRLRIFATPFAKHFY